MQLYITWQNTTCTIAVGHRSEEQNSCTSSTVHILDHDECCSCYCCCLPQPTCYKYVQPEVPKSFAPVRYYWKSDVPMEDSTTYKLSYYEGGTLNAEPSKPEDSLTVGDGPMTDDTTHKLSFLGNWCVKVDPPILPCEKQWLGRGPMQGVTTQKHDYTWKSTKRSDPFKAQDNLYVPCAALSDDTTYRLSYYPSGCTLPTESYAPIRKYRRSDVPMDGCTTYRLSYWPNEMPAKEDLPWSNKRDYHPPVEPVDGCTTYKLSYWPHCEKPRDPIIIPNNDNLLNAGCCFDENTTYNLSYFGCGGDKREPIRQKENIRPSTCPAARDTIHRLSFLGNWCVEPEAPITPCDRQWLGRGPLQDVTTQKHDYTWKLTQPPPQFRPEGNLVFSPLPLECCTTQRLSYMPNNKDSLTPTPSYAPVRMFKRSDVPMEAETIMKLSYQPVETADQVEKPWSLKPPYIPPVNCMEDNTTYNLSYIPPGTLVPQPPCAPCPITNKCQVPPCLPCPAS